MLPVNDVQLTTELAAIIVAVITQIGTTVGVWLTARKANKSAQAAVLNTEGVSNGFKEQLFNELSSIKAIMMSTQTEVMHNRNTIMEHLGQHEHYRKESDNGDND